MIVRSWSARARPSNVEAYVRHFRELLTPELSKLPGFVGASIVQRDTTHDGEPEVQVVVTTRWESYDAIRGFAGDDITAAVVEPAAAAVLESYDRHVEHYSVIYELGPVIPSGASDDGGL